MQQLLFKDDKIIFHSSTYVSCILATICKFDNLMEPLLAWVQLVAISDNVLVANSNTVMIACTIVGDKMLYQQCYSYIRILYIYTYIIYVYYTYICILYVNTDATCHYILHIYNI